MYKGIGSKAFIKWSVQYMTSAAHIVNSVDMAQLHSPYTFFPLNVSTDHSLKYFIISSLFSRYI